MAKSTKLLFLLLVLLPSFTFISAAKNHVVKIQGTIHSYGNVPFNYPGIETSDGKVYAVSGSGELKKILLKNQGFLIEFEGVIIPKEEGQPFALKNGSFEVIKWKKKKLKSSK
ncbi:MAG: hypothetical protein K5829_06975 [Treponema sp.]|nr:hypothetical protein [Treponema sp.]